MGNSTVQQRQREDTIDQLNILLCDELSAIMSYDQALRRMVSPPQFVLGENRESHKRRSILLADAISAQGRISDTGIVIWGAFGHGRSCDDHPIDRRVAIVDLLEGEDRLLARYETARTRVDDRHRQLIAELMPAQEVTRGRISFLWMSGTPPPPLR